MRYLLLTLLLVSRATFGDTMSDFKTALGLAENSIKSGWDKSTSLWTAHPSLEGGSDTLAYGHKLTPAEIRASRVTVGDTEVDFTKGLTEDQASTLLDQDIAEHKKYLAAGWTGFDLLPEKYQNVLVNISFNAGPPDEADWPSLKKAMLAGDDYKVRQEMVTSFKKPDGTKQILTERARDIADALNLSNQPRQIAEEATDGRPEPVLRDAGGATSPDGRLHTKDTGQAPDNPGRPGQPGKRPDHRGKPPT